MVAAGLRNGELCRLRFCDFDDDRNTIRVKQGKGRCDRLVQMPKSLLLTLKQLGAGKNGDKDLFPSNGYRRAIGHISPRTLQRWEELSESNSVSKMIPEINGMLP